MKVVILAGGLPSTIAEDKQGLPKPMVEIGENPILWHIMKSYAYYGFNEFIICAGYRKELIKDYFNDFYIYQSDITVDLKNNTIEIHRKITEDWKVTVVDTGLYASTGQRVGLIQKYIDGDEFIVNFGDCLSNINVRDLLEAYRKNGKLATVALAHPAGRNKILDIDEEGNYLGLYKHDSEENHAWVNAGAYIFHIQVFHYLMGNYQLEKQLLEVLAEKRQIATYKHRGFWSPIETKRDKEQMENLWNAGMAPWKVW